MSSLNPVRDKNIDMLRGWAILTMIAANMAPSVYIAPHPPIFRLFGTFAAPIFTFLSGYMVALNCERKQSSFGYFLKRGMLLLFIASILDISWGLLPLISMDVLYLIGIGTIFTPFYIKIQKRFRFMIPIFIIGLTPILQTFWGYASYPVELDWSITRPEFIQSAGGIFKNWIIQGWFPIFPWLVYPFFGADLYEFQVKQIQVKNIQIICLFSLIIGITLMIIFPGPLYVRAGYSEMFYPPTIGFIFCSLGMILLLGIFTQRLWTVKAVDLIIVLGEASLFFYISHQYLISFINYLGFTSQPFIYFLCLYVILIGILISIGYLLRNIRKKWQNRPYIIRFLIG